MLGNDTACCSGSSRSSSAAPSTRRTRRTPALAAVAATATALATASAPLGVHAFSSALDDFALRTPVSTTNFEENWHLEGGTIPSSDDKQMFLSSGISGRAAWFISRKKLPTSDFEMKFKFQQGGHGGQQDVHKQGFGVW